jgi:antitoxin component YwqK of YwqJK toxin-antitoxin module
MRTGNLHSHSRIYGLLACLLGIGGILWLISIDGSKEKVPSITERRRSELQLRDGRLLLQGVPFTGALVEYYENGKMKSRSRVSNGVLEGLSEGWHTNGVLQVSEHFTQGVSDGPRVKYHENGKKLSEANVVSGKINGSYQRWHDNGTLAERLYFIDGVATGEAASYFPDGSVKARVRLEHGKVVEQRFAKQGEEL